MNSPSPLISKQWNRDQKESGREQGSCRIRNQDFVAPAPYHLPIEVMSVRVREHQHEERTPSGVVSWTVEEKQRCPDQQTKYRRAWANDQHWRANHVILQGKNDSSVQLDNYSKRLPFCGGNLQFWTTTNQQRPESTFEYRGKARKERDWPRTRSLELKGRKVRVNSIALFSPLVMFGMRSVMCVCVRALFDQIPWLQESRQEVPVFNLVRVLFSSRFWCSLLSRFGRRSM